MLSDFHEACCSAVEIGAADIPEAMLLLLQLSLPLLLYIVHIACSVCYVHAYFDGCVMIM